MDNEQERQSASDPPRQPPVPKRIPKVVFKLQRRFRHWAEQAAIDLKELRKFLANEYAEVSRKHGRRLLRVLKVQIDDIRLAFLDLKSRIRSELQLVEPPLDRNPTMGGLPSPGRSKKTPGPFALRPIAPAEASAKMRRVLVVGGMNFFGSMLVRQLNKRGLRDIVVVDEVENGCWKNLPSLRFDDFVSFAELAHGLDPRGRSLGAFSHVFYLAGWEGGKSPLALPKALLAHIAEEGGRFVCLSSAASLGSLPDRKDILLGRPENLRPQSQAGVLSCLFDRYALAHFPRSYLSLKHYRLFGPHEQVDTSIYGLVAQACEQIMAAGIVSLPVELHPDAEQGRRRHDFLSVGDAVRMALHLAESESASGIFEIGSGQSHTALDLVHEVFSVLERKPSVEWIKKPFTSPSPEPEAADLSRIRSSGWSVEPSALHEQVRHYVKTCLSKDEAADENEELYAGSAGEGTSSHVQPPARIFPARKKPFVAKAAV